MYSPTSKALSRPQRTVKRRFRACEAPETAEGQGAQRSVFAQGGVFCWVSPAASAYAEDELETTWRVEEPEEEVEKETAPLPL